MSGQVLRPAIYELKGGEQVEDLTLAGGMGERAFAGSHRADWRRWIYDCLGFEPRTVVSRTALSKAATT